jgi:hypothetical protein
MTIKLSHDRQGVLARGSPPAFSRPYPGHNHFWERAMSRRQFVKTATGATALALGAGLIRPGQALAGSGVARRAPSDPNPIPGGIQPFGPGTELFHVIPPGPGNEPSAITDFNGSVALSNVRGMGTGTNTLTNTTERLIYDVDMRFMQGLYVGIDGHHQHGTFGFI